MPVYQIGWAIHQEKRGKEFRNILIAPPGHDLIEFDAAGQEFRWMAIQTGDETMLSLCAEGEDPHSYMGAAISHDDYREIQLASASDDEQSNFVVHAKHTRKLGKFANLSAQYRAGAKKLCAKARVEYDLPMELDEAKHIRYTYLKTYKGVERYWNSQIALGRKQGFAETLAGRRVQVEGDWHGPLKWSMESTMINFPVQGTGGDQKYLALSVLSSYLAKHGIKFLFDLHDGIYFLCPKDKTQRACVEMKKILDHLPYEKAWGFTPSIPMPWDCKVGPSWGLLKGVK